MTSFLDRRCSVALLRAAAFAALAVVSAIALRPEPANAIEAVQRVVSPGGIQALLIESREVGLISMRFSFRGGAVQDPVDKSGVAYFAGYLFNEGAGDLDAKDLMGRLMRIGSTFASNALTESVYVNFAAPSAHRDEAFALLKLAIASPRFDTEPMERARRVALAALEQENVDPGSRAMRSLARLLYGPTRYAEPIHGSRAALARISEQDVRAYRGKVFARDNLRVAVAGDIDAKTLAKVLDDVFGALPAKAELRAPPSIEDTQAKHETIAVDLPQTMVVFGNTLPALDARQALAAGLFNQVLSAQSTGRLFQALREREGLVYSVSTARGQLEQRDTFYGSFGAAPANAPRALALTMSEIERLVKEGPSAQELEDAKAAFRGGYYLGLDTSANLSGMLLSMLERNLPDTYLADFDAQIAGISIDEVRAVGRLVVRTDKTASVSIGKAD